jgi:hypothetical protein
LIVLGPPRCSAQYLSWAGKQLHIGLSEGEIKLVAARVAALLARPDLATITERDVTS